MNASSINPFFRDIDLYKTKGIKTFNNTIIGSDDEDNYDVPDLLYSVSVWIPKFCHSQQVKWWKGSHHGSSRPD